MKKNSQTLFVIQIFFLLTISLTPVNAEIDGNDIWEVDGYIEYEVDFVVEWNRDLVISGTSTPVYPAETHPNFFVEDSKVTIERVEDDDGDMVFEESTADPVLRAELYGGALGIEYLVDQYNGEDQSDVHRFFFSDTSNFEVGEEVQYEESFSYTDSVGLHRQTKNYEVDSERKFTFENRNSEDVTIDSYELEIEDFDFEYTTEGGVWRDAYSSIKTEISAYGGVLLSNELLIQFYGNGPGATSLFPLLNFYIARTAVEIDGVNVQKPSSDDGIPGFTFFMTSFLIGISIIISKKRSLQSSVLNNHQKSS